MEQEKMTDVALKLNELMYQVGFINNYLSCLGLEIARGHREMAVYSLETEKGLDNMRDVISHIVKNLDDCSASLFEMVDSEEVANENKN